VLAADGEPASISRRGGRGRRLGGQGVPVSLGGGRGGKGGPGGGSEWLVHAAALGLLKRRSSPRRSASGRDMALRGSDAGTRGWCSVASAR
jgi:hypothetical protein